VEVVNVVVSLVSLFIDDIPNLIATSSQFPDPISGNLYSKRISPSWGASTPVQSLGPPDLRPGPDLSWFSLLSG
jgi:hypothetical protein